VTKSPGPASPSSDGSGKLVACASIVSGCLDWTSWLHTLTAARKAVLAGAVQLDVVGSLRKLTEKFDTAVVAPVAAAVVTADEVVPLVPSLGRPGRDGAKDSEPIARACTA